MNNKRKWWFWKIKLTYLNISLLHWNSWKLLINYSPLRHYKKGTNCGFLVMSLLRQEKARDQDFLALFNITTQSRSQLGNFERRTLVEFQYLEGQQNNTISVLHKYGTQIHENNIQGIWSIIESLGHFECI